MGDIKHSKEEEWKMLGANVLVMFLIDFLEHARVTSKQIAVERNPDLLLLREGCTLKALDSFFSSFLNLSMHIQAQTANVKGW